jgi:nucleotide-binding universal stress UspA family protein
MNSTLFQKVVVPFDFSDESVAAVDEALRLVGDAGRIHVLHVMEPIIDVEANLLWANADDDARQQLTEKAIREKLAAAKYQGLQLVSAFGDPGHQIADFAESIGADLIVIPSHGRTGIVRLLIGSTAERVVRLAHCRVLVLKASAKKTT